MSMLSTRLSSRLPLWREPFTALRDEMYDLRSRLLGDDDAGWPSGAIVPPVDVSETDNAIDVRMDVPGLSAKDIDIQISGNMLCVRGKREEEKEEKGRSFHRVERHYGSFCRNITLPSKVNETEVAAEYRDGVLSIKLPKAEDAKAHKIEVKT